MATTYRRFTRIFFLALNVVAAVVFLLACLAPHLKPDKWWFISLLGLGFVFIICTLIAFVLFWLIFKPKYVLISLIPMIIGWKSITVFFSFHIPSKFDYNKPDSVLRIAHWNVARFTEWRRNNNKGSQTRQKMMDLIREQNADVLCIEEFFTSTDTAYYDNMKYIMQELGYPFYKFSWGREGKRAWSGEVIFSRKPIISGGVVRYPKPSMPESLVHIDILYHTDTIRIYTTHLQSVKFKRQEYDQIESIKNTDPGLVTHSKNIFYKLKQGVIYRSIQADVVKRELAASPYPFILTGDFNDVPNSYTYFTIKNDQMQDAFLSTGLGVGRTFSNIAPTLRIDYVFATKEFKIKQFNRIIRNLSDHYMLITDVEMRK